MCWEVSFWVGLFRGVVEGNDIGKNSEICIIYAYFLLLLKDHSLGSKEMGSRGGFVIILGLSSALVLALFPGSGTPAFVCLCFCVQFCMAPMFRVISLHWFPQMTIGAITQIMLKSY